MKLLDLRTRVGATRDWPFVADDAALPDGPVVVTRDRLEAEGDALFDSRPAVGLRLSSDERAEGLSSWLSRLSLIELDFPRFGDGRPFTTARRLREQLGFAGEIRAVGKPLPDQASFLLRSGFDSVALADERVGAAVEQLETFSVWYQPTSDGRLTAMELRRTRRQTRWAS